MNWNFDNKLRAMYTICYNDKFNMGCTLLIHLCGLLNATSALNNMKCIFWKWAILAWCYWGFSHIFRWCSNTHTANWCWTNIEKLVWPILKNWLSSTKQLSFIYSVHAQNAAFVIISKPTAHENITLTSLIIFNISNQIYSKSMIICKRNHLNWMLIIHERIKFGLFLINFQYIPKIQCSI